MFENSLWKGLIVKWYQGWQIIGSIWKMITKLIFQAKNEKQTDLPMWYDPKIDFGSWLSLYSWIFLCINKCQKLGSTKEVKGRYCSRWRSIFFERHNILLWLKDWPIERRWKSKDHQKCLFCTGSNGIGDCQKGFVYTKLGGSYNLQVFAMSKPPLFAHTHTHSINWRVSKYRLAVFIVLLTLHVWPRIAKSTLSLINLVLIKFY